ncbi:MAG TPA: caspase family protein, partial [Kofleriaceae bacterium]|nr:caspase family protein [Kofleriaceae bacterium]
MKLHALLIGVDATPDRPLYGCVHDVDAVQRLVLDPRLGLPVHVTRLVSPQPGAVHDTAIAGAPATLAAIRAALAHLASDAIAADDRVFVYFSGHGARVPVPKDAPELYREALIPVDLEADKPDGAYRLLFDDELNARLAAIARRTRGVTVVLDCCFAAGATRGAAPAGAGRARFVDLREHANACDMRAPDAEHRPLASGVDDCHVIAACLNHELASERPDARGITRGVLTQAVATAIAGALATGGDRPLAALTWAEIWQAVRAEVAAQPSGQHPWMAGNPARRVFGGPPVHGDAGVPVARAGDAYTVEAGTLAGVTRGAELAVYGHQPAYFPALGAARD